MQLDPLFKPKSIAIIGASDKPTIGKRLICSLDRIGFTGSIFPINPSYSTVAGRKCYGNIGELPEVPDVAEVERAPLGPGERGSELGEARERPGFDPRPLRRLPREEAVEP